MRSAVVLACLGFISLDRVTTAHAHIHLTQPVARQTSSQGDPQKEQHCGSTTLTRDPARTTALLPGATITVTWTETVNHPGWFRIAFQPNGETYTIPAPGAGGGFPDVDQTGVTDAAGAIILKDRIPDGTSSYAVTLPNIECTTCTLQLIQVMTDKSPYTTTTSSDDIYFNCADLVLSSTGTLPPGDAGVDVEPPAPESGGCSTTTPSSFGVFGLLLLGLVRRRRQRCGADA